jgi:hypothetical protein
VMMPRTKFEKQVKQIVHRMSGSDDPTQANPS